jgi:hypothetical protein
MWLVALALPLTVKAAPEPGPLADSVLYLPLIIRSTGSISGLVTDGGVPAVGARMTLYHFTVGNGLRPTTVFTNVRGEFCFCNLVALEPGEKFFLIYGGSSLDPAHLIRWELPIIYSFAAHDHLVLSSFDIAGMASLAPAEHEHITLPYTFQWTTRPATPQDSYYLVFQNGNNFFWSGEQGYVGNYTMQSLPPGTSPGESSYYWSVHIASPDGGHGVQHIDRGVYITNPGALDQALEVLTRPLLR